MRRYLISFPSDAMDSIPEEEMSDVDAAAHAVVDEAKEAGVYIFSGGVDVRHLLLGDGVHRVARE